MAVTVFFLLLAAPAVGDTLIIHGARFSLDQIAPVDELSVKVTIAGQSRIIPKAELDDFVVEHFLADPATRAAMDPIEIEGVLKGSLLGRHARQATAVLVYLVETALDQEPWQTLLAGLISNEPGIVEFMQQVFKDTLQRTSGSARTALPPGGAGVLAACAYYSGQWDLDWLRANATGLMLTLSNQVHDYCRTRFFEFLLARDFESSDAVVRFLGAIYGEGDELFKKLKVVSSRIAEFGDLRRTGNVERMFAVLQSVRSVSEIAGIVSPLLVGQIHEEAESALEMHNPSRALKVISLMLSAERTPATHELLLRSLTELPPNVEDQVLLDPAVSTFIGDILPHDARVKQAFLNLLEREVREAVSHNRLDVSESYLKLLVAGQPGAVRQNDYLRVMQAKAYAAAGMAWHVSRKLADIQGSVSLTDRLYFFRMRLMRGSWVTLVLSFLAIAIASLLVIRLRMKSGVTARAMPEGEDDSGGLDDLPPTFAMGMGRRNSRYDDLLAELGLDSGASLKEIKTAYRNAVKEVHPDVQRDSDDRASQKFIQITRIYDQIIALREELGLHN